MHQKAPNSTSCYSGSRRKKFTIERMIDFHTFKSMDSAKRQETAKNNHQGKVLYFVDC